MKYGQIVSMRVQGSSAFAVWVGTGVDPDNPKRLLGAQLLDVCESRAQAEAALEQAAVNPAS